jgi:uncharacterized membrane protein
MFVLANQPANCFAPLAMMDNYHTIRMAKRALPLLVVVLNIIIIAIVGFAH